MIGLAILTARARVWIEENVAAEPWQFIGSTLWIDQRFAPDLIDGAMAEGLEVTA